MSGGEKWMVIVSLVCALSKLVQVKETDETMLKEAQKLNDLAMFALSEYKTFPITEKQLNKVKKHIDRVWNHVLTVNFLEATTFMLCGLDDLSLYVKPVNKELIDPVIDQTVKIQSYFDKQFDSFEVYEKADLMYKRWVK